MNRKDILDAVMVVTEKANSVFPRLDMQIPIVDFYRKGRTAGKAFYFLHQVTFNEVLAQENPNTFFNTVIHEVAHLVTHKLYPFCKQHHGPEFKQVMRMLGGDGKRCHTYNTESVRIIKTKTRYVYKCDCQEHKVTKTTHTKISIGHKFSCKRCKSTIGFTGKVLKIK
jgi:SprT protein